MTAGRQEDDADTLPEHAVNEVLRLHGADGLRAIATFMFAMGSEATLNYPVDGEIEPKWIPCDFVMQHAWALGGTPLATARAAKEG